MRIRGANVPGFAAVAVVLFAAGAFAIWWSFGPRTRTEQLDIYAFHGSPESSTLNIDVGSCLLDVTVDVDETADEVRIGATIEWNTTDDCPDILERVPVVLASPLGDRTVIDAKTGRAVTVEAPGQP